MREIKLKGVILTSVSPETWAVSGPVSEFGYTRLRGFTKKWLAEAYSRWREEWEDVHLARK